MKKLHMLILGLSLISATPLFSAQTDNTDHVVANTQQTPENKDSLSQESKTNYLNAFYAATVLAAALYATWSRTNDFVDVLNGNGSEKMSASLQFLATALMASFTAKQAYKSLTRSLND